MSYRSNVRICTTEQGYDEICKFVDNNIGHNDYQLIGANVLPESREAYGNVVVFGWNQVKWDEGTCADVDSVLAALGHLKELKIPYEFCRIGESWDDVETFEFMPESLTWHIEPTCSFSVYREQL